MTTLMMGPQSHDATMLQFTPHKGQSRRNPGDYNNFNNMSSQKHRGCAPRGNCIKNSQSTQNNHFYQNQGGLQVPRTRPYPTKMLKKFDSNSNIPQFETQPNFYNNSVKGNMNYSGSKNYYGSTASESDSNTSHASSELNGFKIVHKGKVIHDETEEEIESPTDFYGRSLYRFEPEIVKFAASCLVIGPNCQEISLPTFA